MVMNLCEVPMKSVEIYPGKIIILKNAIDPQTYKKSDIVIPIDSKGKMLINWSSKDYMTDFNHIPFFALFEYPRVREIAYEIFDAMEKNSGKDERTRLSTDHHALTSELSQNTDKSQQYEKKIEIRKIENRLTEIETGYLNELRKNTALLKQFASDTGRKPEDLLTSMRITVETEKLKGHSCVIGLTATSSTDVSLTPLSSHYMMPGKYPNIVNTILQGKFMHQVPKSLNYLLMLILALGVGLLIPRLNSKAGVFTFVAALIGANVLISLSFIYANIWFDQLGVSLAVLLPSLSIIAVKFVGEESEKRFIKSAFSQYLSPSVINEIIKDPEKLALGGEERDITIFFSDIAGFSTISEKLNPTQLVALLNEYLTEMTDIILFNDGTIDKYEGDAIIAFFGAPLPYPDHALKCCLATIDMKNRIKELCDIRRSQGESEFFTRMGINTGRAVVGNMGSRTRMDYTMIGDAVNLAARLEGVNKVYKTAAMISEATYEKAKDHIEVRKLDTIRVVGKNEPIVIYELLDRKGNLNDQTQELLDKYYKGLASFNDRDWKGAQKHFKDALKIKPEDGPSTLYVERCTEFFKLPPSKNWDGVYKMKSK
jgi:adenylate cyclase